jgi:oxalate decarboxylase/phosphoglucose isomerase-like protein (cupin superfamily)
MVDTAGEKKLKAPLEQRDFKPRYLYDEWMDSQDVPVVKGYYVEDLRNVEVGWWEARQCNAAFIQLMGSEGVNEVRITEIGPGKSLPSFQFALDEICYVAAGNGVTTVWESDGAKPQTFEWQPHSMFMIPRNWKHQHVNMRGDQSARIMHYNYLPMALCLVRDPEFFFNNPYQESAAVAAQREFYSEAKMEADWEKSWRARGAYWYGNFFPDMRAWDQLVPHKGRGAGGHRLDLQFPSSDMSGHMSVFPPLTYKKGHRHGPGRAIIIPKGEGYSVMWPEGSEKIVIPWHELSMFTPPDRWFHQHFNTGAEPARYLALHPLPQFSGHAEKVQDRAKDMFEYPDEDPWIRQKFEDELAKKGLKSLMPEEAYQNRDYVWAYKEGE